MTGPDSEGLQAEAAESAGQLEYGWRCQSCNFTTFDGSDIAWPADAAGVIDVICPRCQTAGNFVDAIRAPASPVVPSVGAVPVEVPEELLAEAVKAGEFAAVAKCREARHEDIGECSRECSDIRAAIVAAFPLIAARVRGEATADERVLIVAELEAAGQVEAANLIARCTFPDDAVARHDARVRAEERRRISAMIHRDAETLNAFAPGCTAELVAYFVGSIAAGVAVDRVRATAQAMLGWCDDPSASPTVLGSILVTLPVPVDEVVCPKCGATIRARMSDAPEVPVRQQQWYGRAGHCCDIDGNLWHQPGDCQSCHGDCCGYAVVPAAATSPAEQDGQR